MIKLSPKIKEADKRNFYIHRGDNFDISFYAHFLPKPELTDIWLNKKYKVKKDNNITYRIINHWTKLGLLDDARDSDKEWRKFSPTDNVWMHIMSELRRFGFSNEKILNVKKWLFDSEKDDKEIETKLFCYYLTLALSNYPVYLFVLEDGFADIATEDEIEASEHFNFTNANYLKISINNIVNKLFKRGDKKLKRDPKVPLKKGELDLIFMLRQEKYTKIEVISKDGKIERINSSEKIDDKNKKLIDLIREKKFQKIRIEVENGEPVIIERTEKNKI